MSNNIKKLIPGTVQFGLNYGINNLIGRPSEQDFFKVLDVCAENCIMTLDTADAYGNVQNLIGKYHQISKNNFSINSKFNFSDNDFLANKLDKTLSDIKKNNINTYFFHSYSDFVKKPETIVELVKLKQIHKINLIGLSVYDNVEFENAISLQEIDVIQLPFNCLDNFNHRGKLLQKAKDKGKIIQVRSIYLQGLFFMDTNQIPSQLTSLRKYLIRLKNIAKELNLSIAELSIAYVILTSQIDEIVLGVENSTQMLENITLFSKIYDTKIIDEIDKIKVKEIELLYPKNWKN